MEVESSVMDDCLIDSVTYRQWVSVDRSTIETISQSADYFVDSLCEKLEVLLPHSVIARQQSYFQTELKYSLQPGESLVMADIAENYSTMLQDATQFHRNNSQATYHTPICYMNTGELHRLCYVIISDCLHHDTVAVHLFQKNLIDYLRKRFHALPRKIFCF